MLTWSVRVLAVLAYAAVAGVALWTAGVPDGVVYPVSGLVTVAWVAVGLVWLRVLALWVWWSDDRHSWMPTPRRKVGPVKDSVPRRRFGLRRLTGPAFDRTPWVYLRQAAVWLLLPLVFTALVSLGSGQSSELGRSLLRAGAAHTTAIVVEVADVDPRRSDGAVVGYYAKLDLALPNGGTVRVGGTYTHREPKPGDRVELLWAPGAPELGGLVNEDQDLTRYLDRDWGLDTRELWIALAGLLIVLLTLVPVGIGATEMNDGLHELAWSPGAQTVHAAGVTGILLAVLPCLTGTASGLGELAALWAACFGLLVLYLGLGIRAVLI